MTTHEFVRACKQERDALLAVYADPSSESAVNLHLDAAGLNPQQRAEVVVALDKALTDAFYTILMGLAGAASLGGVQQEYRLADGQGRPLSPSGDADLEAALYEAFQGVG